MSAVSYTHLDVYKRQTWTNGGSSGTKYTYTREFGDGIAPQSLEGAVQEVNLSVEGNGYTLDIHEMAIDQNGCGAVTFTLSNPNGVNYYKPAAEIGELVLYGEEEQGIGTPDMKFLSLIHISSSAPGRASHRGRFPQPARGPAL